MPTILGFGGSLRRGSWNAALPREAAEPRPWLLEPLAILWVVRGMRAGSWDHAFKLLSR